MSEEVNNAPVDVRELVRWAERTQRNLESLASQQEQFSAELQRSREESEEHLKRAREEWEERWRERVTANEEQARQRDERIKRNIEFVASQQAQFSADLERSREEREEEWKKQQERWRKADARWAETEKGIRALLAIAEIHEKEVEALKDSQERTGKQLAETGVRVDALVDAVEQLISRRHNGGEPGEG